MFILFCLSTEEGGVGSDSVLREGRGGRETAGLGQGGETSIKCGPLGGKKRGKFKRLQRPSYLREGTAARRHEISHQQRGQGQKKKRVVVAFYREKRKGGKKKKNTKNGADYPREIRRKKKKGTAYTTLSRFQTQRAGGNPAEEEKELISEIS